MANKEDFKRLILESVDIEKAEVVLAAKSMVDDLQGMIEKLAKMQVQDLMPIVDRIKVEFGIKEAQAFETLVGAQLQSALDAVKDSKDSIENSVLVLSGEAPQTSLDMEDHAPIDVNVDKEVDVDVEQSDEELPELDTDLEEPSDPLGRARKTESIKRKSKKKLNEAHEFSGDELDHLVMSIENLEYDAYQDAMEVLGLVDTHRQMDPKELERAIYQASSSEVADLMKLVPQNEAWGASNTATFSKHPEKIGGTRVKNVGFKPFEFEFTYKDGSKKVRQFKGNKQEALLNAKTGAKNHNILDKKNPVVGVKLKENIKEAAKDHMYEVTFVDSGKTITWSEKKCIEYFGKDQWDEIKAGYLPHIVAVNLSETVLNEDPTFIFRVQDDKKNRGIKVKAKTEQEAAAKLKKSKWGHLKVNHVEKLLYGNPAGVEDLGESEKKNPKLVSLEYCTEGKSVFEALSKDRLVDQIIPSIEYLDYDDYLKAMEKLGIEDNDRELEADDLERKLDAMSDNELENLYKFVATAIQQEVGFGESLYEVAPPDMEAWASNPKTKAAFKKKYGSRWQQVMYATAWKMHNKKKGKKTESIVDESLAKIKPGTRVQIQGTAEYNGKKGKVIWWDNGDHIYLVRLDDGSRIAFKAENVNALLDESIIKHKIEAYGVKGFDNKRWRKTFKDETAMKKWADNNNAEIYGTRDLENPVTLDKMVSGEYSKKNEARDPNLEYEEEKQKTTGKVEKLILRLQGSQSGSMTKLASKYKELLIELEKIDETRDALNNKIKEEFGNLFDAEDAYITRVIDTMGVTATLAKLARKEDFVPEAIVDYETALEEIMKLLDKDLIKQAKKIVKLNTTISKFDDRQTRSPALRVTLKKEKDGKKKVKESIFDDVKVKLKNYANSFANALFGAVRQIDNKLAGIKSLLRPKHVSEMASCGATGAGSVASIPMPVGGFSGTVLRRNKKKKKK